MSAEERTDDRRSSSGRRKEDVDWQQLVEDLTEELAATRAVVSGLRKQIRVQWVLYALVIIGCALFIRALEQEADDRQDGQCQIFEGQHLDDVTVLGNTYAFLLTVEPEDRNDALYKFAIRQLPTTEARAYRDRAPQYCDEEGIGLPEPDPEIPLRPKALKHLPSGIPPEGLPTEP